MSKHLPSWERREAIVDNLTYSDTLTYGILVCYEPDGPRLRQRRHMYDWKGEEILATLARYSDAWDCRVEYRVGPLGIERTRYIVEGNVMDEIREDGVPHTICGDVRTAYGLGSPACAVCGDLGCEFCPRVVV